MTIRIHKSILFLKCVVFFVDLRLFRGLPSANKYVTKFTNLPAGRQGITTDTKLFQKDN
jgi:hypothetical protein